jgi:hypothetical protein
MKGCLVQEVDEQPQPAVPCGHHYEQVLVQVCHQTAEAMAVWALADFPVIFRAKLDNNPALSEFCTDLEAAVIETIEAGQMTKDLAICVHGTTKVSPDQYLDTEAFMNAISATFAKNREAKSKL